eukprot:384264-Prorocentrum_minimum.AAC.1
MYARHRRIGRECTRGIVGSVGNVLVASSDWPGMSARHRRIGREYTRGIVGLVGNTHVASSNWSGIQTWHRRIGRECPRGIVGSVGNIHTRGIVGSVRNVRVGSSDWWAPHLPARLAQHHGLGGGQQPGFKVLVQLLVLLLQARVRRQQLQSATHTHT